MGFRKWLCRHAINRNSLFTLNSEQYQSSLDGYVSINLTASEYVNHYLSLSYGRRIRHQTEMYPFY